MLHDVRYGIRMLARKPGFAALAALTLALGIGANTAIFSVIDAVLLKPLPYKDTDRLVLVWEQNPERGWYRNIVSAANFLDWRRQNDVFTEMAAINPEKDFNLTRTGKPEEVSGELVTTNLFSLLGVRPLLGRDFLPEEDKPGGPRVVILSYGLWERRYGHDPTLVGKQISLNNESYTVVGIMPAGFYFPPFWRQWAAGELWVPGLDLSNPERTFHNYVAIARLKPDVTLERAQSEMDTIARRIVQQSPDAKGWAVGLVGLREQAVGDTRRPLMVLFGAVGFVLLIACANVANLMLARSAAREREVAIRTALGANRGQLIRQFLTESLLLALLGGTLGLLVAPWVIKVLASISGEWALGSWGGANLADVRVNGAVLAFTTVVTLATGIIAGLAPALGSSAPDLNRSLREGSRGAGEGVQRHRLRSVLVVSEFALALILLAGAGLMIRTLILMRRVDLGFNPHNVLTMTVPLLGPRYQEQRAQAELFTALLERVKTLPGVQWASVSRGLPVEDWNGWGFVTEDNPSPPANEEPDGNYQVTGPDYFRAMGIPLREGRFFTAQDTQQAMRVVIVNEELARTQWPAKDPVGRRLRVNMSGKPWLTVIGVVGNVRTEWPMPQFRQELYLPYTQYPWDLAPRHLIVRTAVNPAAMAAAVRREVAALDKDQPVSDVRTLEDVVAEAVGPQRFAMMLLGSFAALAVVLASVGIYGVMAYSVSQRTHEIGIRMALGAQRGNVLSMVVGEALVLALIGAGLGLAGAWGLTRLLSSLLYNVRPTDPLTFALVPLLLVGVSAFASYIPARRATRVDPIVALRYE
ncbi:MAG TPA: ABC transporter permease [Terriglobia bacterium]|nr:ABC transporter permease [Terriglobia bacterium]